MSDLIKREGKQTLLPTSSFGKKLDHLFRDFFSEFDRSLFKHDHSKEPKVNISEDEKAYYVDVALPGYKKEDVKINCERGVLSIEARKEEKKEESKKNCYYSEYSSGSFYRSFQLPSNSNAGKIDAEMKDGLLKIILPKAEEKPAALTNVTIR
jgi:HSP20 family protein